ncbi:hypothetical protein [Salinisphaera orenii]|uniref:hypothetical protein n=1 Tax=Salinisphaera orenii TaxID=856731 RepID=UPI000DBE6EEA
MRQRIAYFLVCILIAGGVLASPAVMAWSMTASSSPANDCAPHLVDPAGQQQTSAGTIATPCVVAGCALMATIDSSINVQISPIKSIPTGYRRNHSGRLLEAPDPFPPRLTHA